MDLLSLAPAAPANLLAATEQARLFTAAARAANTRRTYEAQWRRFVGWCGDNHLCPLPAAPETLALYLAASAAALKTGSLAVALAAIKAAHVAARLPIDDAHPAVRQVWEGIRRVNGVRQTGKAPLLPAALRAMAGACSDDRRGRRNRALLLVGFASALRRSELVALDVADLTFEEQGVRLLVRRSKTDQAGHGQEVCVPYGRLPDLCPVTALRAWLAAAGIETGAVFRRLDGEVLGGRLSDRSVANIVKASAAGVGLDATLFSGHSLRAGLATAAALAGADLAAIMRQTRHQSPAVALRYVRLAERWRDNVVGLVL